MRTLLRVAVSALFFGGTFLIMSAVSSRLLSGWTRPEEGLLITMLAALTCTIALTGYVWSGTGLVPRLVPSLLGGIVAGGMFGFIIGFVGPLLSSQSTNLAPLLAFFTTPVGAFAGGLAGFGYWDKEGER